MLEKNQSVIRNNFRIFGMSLTQALVVTTFGVVAAIGNMASKLPLHIPGHRGLLIILALTACCIMIRKPGAGTLAGFIGGFVTVFVAPGVKGIFAFFDFLLPGILMDVFVSVIPISVSKWYMIGAAAGLAHLAKLLASYILADILNLPMSFLSLGLSVVLVSHLIIGFIGGVIAYFVCARVVGLRQISQKCK
ncbi:hypothetical protein SPSIL_029400 [Sporomusa silvacetica DSM 10669]|uniref:Energy-coupling factor transport system substrate-specific component n=2 Tax=Sporomusa silvacetica TaxID=55504 RepID=A0ABZ3IMG1_9FIRM|nr:hypothetical protein SPSIL_40400 [Sporomusa silvacetica DSM 10669]